MCGCGSLEKRLAVASNAEVRRGEGYGARGQKSVGKGGQDADRHSATLLLSTLRVLLPLLPAWSLFEVYRAPRPSVVVHSEASHSFFLILSLSLSISFCHSCSLSCFLSLALYYPRSLSSFHTLSNFGLSSRDQDPKPTFASTAFLQVTDK